MKRLYLILFWFLFLFGWFSGGAFAVEFPWDCDLVVDTYKTEWTFKAVDIVWTKSAFWSDLEKMLDSASLNQALLNMKKVCCNHNKDFQTILSDTCEEDRAYFFDGNVAESYYLFDHVLDVILRRLDWDAKNWYLMDNLDTKGSERRQKMDEIMLQTEGDENTMPSVISDEYQAYWTLNPENFTEGMVENPLVSLAEVVQIMESDNNMKIVKNYEEWSLWERYVNACNLAWYIYAKFYQSSINVPSLLKTRWNLIKNGENQCVKLVNQRLDAEKDYVKYVAISKWNMMFTDNVDKYVNTYLWERLSNLEELIMNTKARFMRVMKAVPKLVHITM